MNEINCLELIDKFISSDKGSILQKETTDIFYAKTNIFLSSLRSNSNKNNLNNKPILNTYYCEDNKFNFEIMSKIKKIQINNKNYSFTEKSPNLTIIEKIN
jgi:hypothetical protein